MKKKIIKKHCLKIIQNKEHPLYIFSLTGEELQIIADVSRVNRNDQGTVLGYQRPEVRSHIREILNYLDCEEIIFPNAIILAINSDSKFIPSKKNIQENNVIPGIIEITIDFTSKSKSAWIVDGQQRAYALWNSSRKQFPVPITAFFAEDLETQRDQFLRVNNTRPLPKGLINELLPEVQMPISQELSKKKIPSIICDLLSRRPESPFHGLIRRPSTPKEERKTTVITDTSIILMLEESITSPAGCLFTYHSIGTGETDIDGILRLIILYWTCVKGTFPEAWGKSPLNSRLMHGVGIRAMGKLMDKIMPCIHLDSTDAAQQIEAELKIISHYCRWTEGTWKDLGNIAWNEIQNTPRHLKCISDYLVKTYIFEREKSR